MSSEPRCSSRRPTASAVGGASNGCSVRRTWSRTISTGARSTQGTSMRRPRQNFDIRQQNAGSQLTPDSISTSFRRGKLTNTPWLSMLASCACMPWV